jgi:hypothetical protein
MRCTPVVAGRGATSPGLASTRSRRRQLDADPAWRRSGLSTKVLLLQATGEGAAAQMVLPAEGLAARVLLDEATYFGTTATLASCMDSFAAHASSSSSTPDSSRLRLV